MATAPTPAELGPLLAETQSLDEPLGGPYEDENAEYMSAARTAVGSDAKALALKDAISAHLRELGLIGGTDDEAEAIPLDDDSDVGEGFPDL